MCALAEKKSSTTTPTLYWVTVGTEETDGLKRLRESAAEFGHELHVVGLGQEWNGGDMTSVVRVCGEESCRKLCLQRAWSFFLTDHYIVGRRPEDPHPPRESEVSTRPRRRRHPLHGCVSLVAEISFTEQPHCRYDVIVNADEETILRRFLTEFADYRVLFSAEPFCWPDRTLAPKYPPVTFGER